MTITESPKRKSIKELLEWVVKGDGVSFALRKEDASQLLLVIDSLSRIILADAVNELEQEHIESGCRSLKSVGVNI